jgi:NAD(P)-dependent dehydrogenase (short-subunit alcohol dehydrogenase family)
MVTALRDGLLDGVAVGLHGEPPAAVADRLRALGAHLAADAATHVVAVPGGDLLDALDGVWESLAPPAGELVARGGPGKLILLAPEAGAGVHARAVRAGIENLARTLGTEWSRHGITTVAILAGADSDALAELVAYLVSPAGDYFSGCALTLGSSAHGTTTASS